MERPFVRSTIKILTLLSHAPCSVSTHGFAGDRKVQKVMVELTKGLSMCLRGWWVEIWV